MSQSQEVLQKIDETVKSERVVLFMKGTRNFPQCGFSATVVQILNGLLPEYRTVNVLEDPAVRQGIKDYSDWPTIPQLYVGGEFVGGCDIVREMHARGELQEKLGVSADSIEPPKITITDAAARAIESALEEAEEGDRVHLAVDPRFEHSLGLAKPDRASISVESSGIELYLDLVSAQRADGVTIDFVEGPSESGFKIDNPNAPPKVRQIPPKKLEEKLNAGEIEHLFDVRTPEEREKASIGGRLLDDDTVSYIATLPKDTPLAFYCHRGGRSLAAGEHFVAQGFREVYNLAGGIDAWSQEVDPDVPRY